MKRVFGRSEESESKNRFEEKRMNSISICVIEGSGSMHFEVIAIGIFLWEDTFRFLFVKPGLFFF